MPLRIRSLIDDCFFLNQAAYFAANKHSIHHRQNWRVDVGHCVQMRLRSTKCWTEDLLWKTRRAGRTFDLKTNANDSMWSVMSSGQPLDHHSCILQVRSYEATDCFSFLGPLKHVFCPSLVLHLDLRLCYTKPQTEVIYGQEDKQPSSQLIAWFSYFYLASSARCCSIPYQYVIWFFEAGTPAMSRVGAQLFSYPYL